MGRIMEPLGRMGASISARDGRFPPLEIRGARLRAIDYTLPVPSAQVKTCVLFAGLYAEGETIVREPVRSRDHTEIALREFGADLRVEGQHHRACAAGPRLDRARSDGPCGPLLRRFLHRGGAAAARLAAWPSAAWA